jgi:hypothetical protein
VKTAGILSLFCKLIFIPGVILIFDFSGPVVHRPNIKITIVQYQSFYLSIYLKHEIRNVLTERERPPQDRFTRGWCQKKGNNPYICTIYLRFCYMNDKYKKRELQFSYDDLTWDKLSTWLIL